MYGEGAYNVDKKTLGKSNGESTGYDGKTTDVTKEKGSGTLNNGDIMAIGYWYNSERRFVLVFGRD
jgi:hypothetical protein